MSLTSFLFGGTPPSNINTTTSDTSQLPAWYQEYLQGIMGSANTLGTMPYPQFQGPMLADFNPAQNQAFSMSGALPSATSGNLSAANTALGNAAGTNIPGAVNPYLSASSGYNPTTAAQPYMNNASNFMNTAAGYNPAAATAPYLSGASALYGASAGINPSAAAQPYMNNASNYMGAAGNTLTPGGIQSYMSPYTNSVVQGLQNQANMNWNQNIMPAVNNEFIGSGQYGSGRNAQVLGQAANNFQTNLDAQTANVLESGYNTAGTLAGQQAGILGALGNSSLSQAGTAGSLAGQGASILQGAGSGIGALGTTAGGMAGNTANIYGALGNTALTQAGTAGTQAATEAGLQQSAANIAGTAAQQQGALQNTVGATQGALAQTGEQIALQNAAAEQAVGNQQQQQSQLNLNTAYQQFNNQALWPETQLSYISDIVRGLPTPGTTTTVNSNQPPSPFTQFAPSLSNVLLGAGTAGSAGGHSGLLPAILGGAEGGRVPGALQRVKGYAGGGNVVSTNIDGAQIVPPSQANPQNLASIIIPLILASLMKNHIAIANSPMSGMEETPPPQALAHGGGVLSYIHPTLQKGPHVSLPQGALHYARIMGNPRRVITSKFAHGGALSGRC